MIHIFEIDDNYIYIIIFIILERESVIDITEPCRYPVAVGIEKEYIPNHSLWATSQTNQARGPEFARLRGWRGRNEINY